MEPIAFIRHEPSAGPGVMGDVLTADGIDHIVVKAWDRSQGWPAASEISALVVLGGEMNVDDTEHYPFLLRSRAMLEEAMGNSLPVIGVCLGAQMLARVLGSPVLAGSAREIGFHRVEQGDGSDEMLAPINDLEGVFQWHQDSFTVPSQAVLLHENQTAPQSFRYGDNVFGVQFHFEVTANMIQQWCAESEDLEGEWDTNESELMDQARKMLGPQQRAAATITRNLVALCSSR
jgi:GMP synthase (glutamine-hydrolysing)